MSWKFLFDEKKIVLFSILLFNSSIIIYFIKYFTKKNYYNLNIKNLQHFCSIFHKISRKYFLYQNFPNATRAIRRQDFEAFHIFF